MELRESFRLFVYNDITSLAGKFAPVNRELLRIS